MILERHACYQAAVDELEGAAARGAELAGLLEHFAARLRGEPSDGPGPDALPGRASVSLALARIDQALRAVRREYDRLPDDVRECMPEPDSLLGGGWG